LLGVERPDGAPPALGLRHLRRGSELLLPYLMTPRNHVDRNIWKVEGQQESGGTTPAAGGAESPENLSALTARVIARWRTRLRRLPDGRERSGERGDNERNLVRILLRATETESSTEDESLPALAAAAARYGAGQRRERIDPGGLCDELGALRNAVWEVLKEQDPDPHRKALARILSFDRALSIVLRAAVTAGYDPEQARDSIRCRAVEGETSAGAIETDGGDRDS